MKYTLNDIFVYLGVKCYVIKQAKCKGYNNNRRKEINWENMYTEMYFYIYNVCILKDCLCRYRFILVNIIFSSYFQICTQPSLDFLQFILDISESWRGQTTNC